MARDRKAEAARRNERARALGYESYGQQHRAQRAGYRAAGQYQAAVEARRNPAGMVARKAASGRLLGGLTTTAGVVISADWTDPDEVHEQWRAVNRFGAMRRLTLSLEWDTGRVMHLGGDRGGYRLSWVRRKVAELGSWEAFVLWLVFEVVLPQKYKGRAEWDDAEIAEIIIVTVTVV